MDTPNSSEVIIFVGGDGKPDIQVKFEGGSVWLTQAQLVELFQSSKANVSEHIKAIFEEGELSKLATVRNLRTVQTEGAREVARDIEHYNLEVILALGYRIKSKIATQFRIWATERLHEYITKGFAIDSDRLKSNGGGNYWKELLDEIRDIRSSEKVLYRQVLDLYATSTDYSPKSDESLKFFKIVQNKLHYAAHGHTASEVIYLRVDSDKPFAGLTSFKGSQPTQAEAMIAKNFLEANELKVLNNLVSSYFDMAEINAIEQKPMRMSDYVQELDNILNSTKRKLLNDAGKVTAAQAETKAKVEFKKYKAKTLSEVEKSYLAELKATQKKLKDKA
jgi:hypothetical protein